MAGLPHRPVLSAFTATATEEVRRDIVRLLRLNDPAVVVTGFDRPNLFFDVRRPQNKLMALRAFLKERPGRAGRDGEPAECVLLYAPGDVTTARFLIERSADGNEDMDPKALALLREQDSRRLSAMVNYCKTTGCLRSCLLRYFGQNAPSACGNCGSCKGAYVETDITTPAQMILSCVRRIHDKLGYYVGTALVVRVLRGSGDRRIRELGLDELSTFGLLKGTPRETINGYIDRLMELSYLFVEHIHTTLRPTAKASEVLFHGEKVTMLTRLDFREERPRRRADNQRSGRTVTVDDGLLAALKAARTRLAQQEEVPAYIIFSNATLADMAAKAPRTIDQFLQVSGVGEVKAERYGSDFLRVISEYIERGNKDAGAEGIR